MIVVLIYIVAAVAFAELFVAGLLAVQIFRHMRSLPIDVRGAIAVGLPPDWNRQIEQAAKLAAESIRG